MINSIAQCVNILRKNQSGKIALHNLSQKLQKNSVAENHYIPSENIPGYTNIKNRKKKWEQHKWPQQNGHAFATQL